MARRSSLGTLYEPLPIGRHGPRTIRRQGKGAFFNVSKFLLPLLACDAYLPMLITRNFSQRGERVDGDEGTNESCAGQSDFEFGVSLTDLISLSNPRLDVRLD